MIKFKQKEFFWNAVMGITSIAGIGQGISQSNQNEELAEQQRRSDAKTRAALEKLAKSDASPEKKQQAASLFSDRAKLFAAPGGSVLKNLAGLGKDLWTHSGSGVKNAAKMGAGFAAAGYIGNKVASGLKNHDEGEDKKTLGGLAKVGAAAGTLAAGVWAAKKGKFNKIPGLKGAQNFMTTGYGGRAINAGKNVLKEHVNPIKRKDNGKLGINASGAMGLGFAMTPAISYLAQRKSQDDMTNSTQPQEEDTQRQYAVPGAGMIKNSWGWIKGVGQGFKKDWKRTLTGGFNKASNFMGMMGGKGGTEAVQAGARKLENIGKNSGNIYTQKLARWAQNNPNKANLAAGVGTMAVGGAAMGLGEKIVNKPMKALDRDAYKIEEQENDQI